MRCGPPKPKRIPVPRAPFGITLAPPSILEEAQVAPEYVRLPRPGEVDPVYGLKRSYLNMLILPCKQNSFKPPVRSSSLREPGAKQGVRLINVESLRTYLASQMDPRPVVTHMPGEASSAEFMRLPKPGHRDPLFGLTRSFLAQLILPSPENGHSPPVLSHVLRRRGYLKGIRLISVDSLREYIRSHESK
jgi:hypothetical protein